MANFMRIQGRDLLYRGCFVMLYRTKLSGSIVTKKEISDLMY
jgi:hypothetical protein